MSKNSQWSHVSTPATTNKLDELICDKDGVYIAWAYKKDHARLIAQAPRLLEALELIIERFGPCQNDYVFSKRLALDKARAAIAAATEGDSHD